jgi:hypothetical protein
MIATTKIDQAAQETIVYIGARKPVRVPWRGTLLPEENQQRAVLHAAISLGHGVTIDDVRGYRLPDRCNHESVWIVG